MIDFYSLVRFGNYTMDIFFESFWIWIVLTIIAGFGGFSWYSQNQNTRNLIIAVLLPILTFALGQTLYFGINTDRKTIRRTLDSLIAAVEKDDYSSVHKFISPKAQDLQDFARERMNFARISRTKCRNLTIEINDAPSPPLAKVQFSAIFYWKNKIAIEGFSLDEPIPENIRFELELVKTKSQSWLLTDNYKCSVSRFP